MCEALQRNTYSWYHPSEYCARSIVRDMKSFARVSTSELMLLTRLGSEGESDPLVSRRQYSHALSHKLLGLLLNNLMIFFPIWKNRERFCYPLDLRDGHPEILNTKFEGDFVSSLTYSHWQARNPIRKCCGAKSCVLVLSTTTLRTALFCAIVTSFNS